MADANPSPIEALVHAASARKRVHPDDGKSGSSFEEVTIDGERYFFKVVSPADDWITRVIGDTELWPHKLWRSGLFDEVPPCIDHALVDMAVEGTGHEARLGQLMHDVGTTLVPEGDTVVDLDTHLRFLDHMAALHAHFWGWTDTIGLMPLANRFRVFAPDNIAPELARTPVPVPIEVAARGWPQLEERAPDVAKLVRAIHTDPSPLVGALSATPQTFLHGDWKMGNLGEHPDGRTVLLDWAYPGAGPASYDLAWYLALNAARLPHSKEDAIEAYRRALEHHGVDTSGWWERQLGLSLLGMTATLGWEKAIGEDGELRWWCERALEAMRWLP